MVKKYNIATCCKIWKIQKSRKSTLSRYKTCCAFGWQVELFVGSGIAELTIKVRCERIVPVRGAVADLFKKTSVIITRVIEVAYIHAIVY